MIKKLLRSVFSQKSINSYYHLPKALMANVLHGFPTKDLKVIGVTGTDGKTTTTNMIYQILKDAGKKVSMVSTINAVVGGKVYDTGFHVTSPDPLLVQKFAKAAKQNGDEYLVLEVTSHALDQFRFWGIKFDIAVITNITHEHLDYHKTFENYKNTKLKLIKETKFAIVNQNISVGNVKGKKITFGLNKGDFNQKDLKISLKIPGDYNLENALAAMAVAFILEIPKNTAIKTLEKFEGLEGRMQFIKNNLGLKIIVDFAHTPNALENVLKTLKKETKSGKLISVFGAAARRDSQKRPLMGQISVRFADVTILTDEDPRDEDRNKIIEDIADGGYKEGAKDSINLFKEPDRQKAIELAISLAKKGDVIGIFGKGHEKSMNINGKELPWSDVQVLEKVLKDGRKV